jgi:hypothetical protein
MNILWLSSPFRKDDIMTNKDAIWVYTDNELREGGGEMVEFMRGTENCHPIISRETIGKDGYFREDNIARKSRMIHNYFDALHIRIKQGKLAILPTIEINEAIIEMEKHAPILGDIFSSCVSKTNKFKMTTLI